MLTRIACLLWIGLLCTATCFANDPRDHVVRVRHSSVESLLPPRVRTVHGNGICISPQCTLVVTAWHIQAIAGRGKIVVPGRRTEKVLWLASDSDSNKVSIAHGKSTLSFDPSHDIALIYTSQSHSHKSGAPLSYHAFVGQRARIVGYHNSAFHTTDTHIIGKNAPLILNGGARLDENLVLDVAVSPGDSGSAVLDEDGNLLGMVMLDGAIKVGSGTLHVSIVLPTRRIAAAAVKLDPQLGASLFPNIPEDPVTPSNDGARVIEEKDIAEDSPPVIPEMLATTQDMPEAVEKMRAKAEAGVKLMKDLVAQQCVAIERQKLHCHEVAISDGAQIIREKRRDAKAGKLLDHVPIPGRGGFPLSEWADTLGEIADNTWLFQGTVGDRYLFTYNSNANEDRCYFEEHSRGVPLFGGGYGEWSGSVGCSVQVLTDREFNILAAFTEMYPPPAECRTEKLQTAVYYDWVKLQESQSLVLLPVMEKIAAKFRGQTEATHSEVSWNKYRKFRVKHKVGS